MTNKEPETQNYNRERADSWVEKMTADKVERLARHIRQQNPKPHYGG